MAKRPPKKATERDLIRIATFILFDAAIFHDSLTGAVAELKPLRTARAPYSKFLTTEWDRILAMNYAPVFEIARDVLNSLPASPKVEAILKSIIDAALEVVSSGILMKHDFMGRVYHKLLLRTTGQYYATYYTSIPSAWLLAHLVFKTDNPAWNSDFSDLDQLRHFRIIDCACGSGTLLSASYMALKDRYVLSGPERLDVPTLHRTLVEEVLSGWDVLEYAAHLTLTSLALHSTRTSITKSNVYVVPAGVSDSGRVHLGSLDRLQPNIPLMGRGFGEQTRRKGLGEDREEEIPSQRYDVVIMNPPFTRSAKPNIKFGYRDAATRTKMTRALAQLGRSLVHYGYDPGAIGNTGLAAYFMFLAAQLVKMGGRVAAVLPRSTLSGVGFSTVRSTFLRDFHLEYVVSNFDPGDAATGVDPWSFSENTDIGEVLIVARRREPGPAQELARERTCFVGIWRKPRNEVGALLLSQQIVKKAPALTGSLTENQYAPIEAHGVTSGVLYFVGTRELEQNWLAPAVFAAPDLNRRILEIRRAANFVKLTELVESHGYDISPLKAAFKHTDAPTEYRIVWGHQGAMNTLRLDPRHVGYGRARRGNTSDVIFQHYAADLLIADRPHLSTENSLIFLLNQRVMATAFWEVRLNNPNQVPVVALWLASTFGFMQYLSIATSSQGDIFKMKKAQLLDLLIPDPSNLDLRQWSRTLDRVELEPVQCFRAQFEEAARGQAARLEIDRFVARHTGLTPFTTAEYELLARDPVISKTRL